MVIAHGLAELSFRRRQLTKDLSKFLVHLMGSSIFTSPPAKQTPVLDQAGLHHLVASGLIHIPLGVILLSELDCTLQVASLHDHGTTLFPDEAEHALHRPSFPFVSSPSMRIYKSSGWEIKLGRSIWMRQV